MLCPMYLAKRTLGKRTLRPRHGRPTENLLSLSGRLDVVWRVEAHLLDIGPEN